MDRRTKSWIAVGLGVLLIMFVLLVLITPIVTLVMTDDVRDGYIDLQMLTFIKTMNIIYIVLTGLLTLGAVFGTVEFTHFLKENDLKLSDVTRIVLQGQFEANLADF